EAPRKAGRLNSTHRGARSKFFPAQCDMNRQLTPSEIEEEGYHLLDVNWLVYLRTNLASDFHSLLEELAKKGAKKKKCTKYNIAFTVECTRKPNSIHPSRLTQHENPRVMEVARLIPLLAQKIITSTPGAWTRAHDDVFSVRRGSPVATRATSARRQFKSTTFRSARRKLVLWDREPKCTTMAATREDAPFVIFFLSYLPKNSLPFSMTSFRLTCTATSQTALVLDANYPHGGSGDGEYPECLTPDCPIRYYPPAGYT
ncbi:hypothetical protein BUE80_DR004773, partial [Diplocarpon rosae]